MNRIAVLLMASNFGLGGSRRMAAKYPELIKISDNTDWDFYCSDTAANRDYLDSLGFAKIEAENRNYWDNLLLDIYKHPTENIEVLIRSDRELYQQCFESIEGQVFYDKLWKSAPHQLGSHKNRFRQQVCSYFNDLFHSKTQLEETL